MGALRQPESGVPELSGWVCCSASSLAQLPPVDMQTVVMLARSGGSFTVPCGPFDLHCRFELGGSITFTKKSSNNRNTKFACKYLHILNRCWGRWSLCLGVGREQFRIFANSLLFLLDEVSRLDQISFSSVNSTWLYNWWDQNCALQQPAPPCYRKHVPIQIGT